MLLTRLSLDLLMLQPLYEFQLGKTAGPDKIVSEMLKGVDPCFLLF